MDLDPVSVQYNINVVVGFKRSTIVHWQLVVINSTAHPQDLFTAISVLFMEAGSLRHKETFTCVF